MIKKVIINLIIIFMSFQLVAQENDSGAIRVEPPFWWTGMADSTLQLLVYGNNISEFDVEINSNKVVLEEVILVENPNYLFLDLVVLEDALPGDVEITFMDQQNEVFHHHYELKKRDEQSSERTGFDASDVIYLVMPDRFSNGDPSNDNTPGMLESADRSNPDGRHGGDLQGIGILCHGLPRQG